MERVDCYLCGSKSNSHNNILLRKEDSDNIELFNINLCKCGFNFLNPRPSASEIGEYYKYTEYHPHARGRGLIYYFFNLSRKITYRWKLKIMKNQSIQSIKHLDYGGGDGSFTKFLIGKGVESISYDKFYSDIKNDIIKKSQFNLITLWHSLEHIHDLDTLFSEIDQFLDKKGKVIISVPNFDAPERKYFKNNWKAYDVPRHLYHFDSFSLDMLLKNKDFKVLKRKRMLLDTIYISILSKNDDIGYVKLSYIIIKSIFITLLKGPRFSSSLLYICEKNN